MSSPSFIQTDPNVVMSSHAIIGPSERRLGITFYPSIDNAVTINTRPIKAFGDGLTISAAGIPYRISRETHGDVVTQGWYAWYNGTSGTALSWVEDMLCNDYPTFYG